MALGLFLTLWAIESYPQSAQEVARSTFPSVVLISTSDAAGQPLSVGSGFFVDEGVVATNAHVIRGAATARAKLVGEELVHSVVGVVGVASNRDLALLKVEKRGARGLEIETNSKPSIGDTVYAVGNPLGLEGTFSAGIVSGIRRIGKESLIQITAPISPGSSGGPVLNAHGRVIGVAVATFSEGQNLNFAIPAADLRDLMNRMTEPVPLSRALQGVGQDKNREERFRNITDAVSIVGLRWVDADFSKAHYVDSYVVFSLRNGLPRAVQNVEFLIVYRARDGKPIHSAVGRYEGTVLPGLAKFLTQEYLNSPIPQVPASLRSVAPRLEVRILNFELAEP